MKNTNGTISGTLVERVKQIDFLRLSKLNLPSSILFTIVEKLSSRTIISAAFFAKSDPEPKVTPISAF